MSHYTQNIHSLLTRRFKISHMIFKSEFGVENEAGEFRFFDYFYRRFFPRRMLGSGGGGGGDVLLVKVNAYCLGGGDLEAVL